MDQVAIVGVGTTPFARYLPGRTMESLAVEAAKNAILDAGLGAADIDGICTSDSMRHGSFAPEAASLQEALGIPATTWTASVTVPFSFLLMEAVHAVFAGSCTTALIVHPVYRIGPVGDDPFRPRMVPAARSVAPAFPMTDGYASFAARYVQQYGGSRMGLGLVAINDRQHAVHNAHAVMREPMTMDDYLNARMVRWPLGLFDMDLPIDGADALVVTRAERARDRPKKAVYVHATSAGRTGHPTFANTESLAYNGQHVAIAALRRKTGLWIDDADLLYAYDGYTVITVNWLENLGFCEKGEAGSFLRDSWDPVTDVARIGGRVPMNSHGGNLSEGGTQGSGDFREAVLQLRGECGDRQVPGHPKVALLAIGGIYMNSSLTVLRTD
jgi:acetyl-CoA acetyltransferase